MHRECVCVYDDWQVSLGYCRKCRRIKVPGDPLRVSSRLAKRWQWAMLITPLEMYWLRRRRRSGEGRHVASYWYIYIYKFARVASPNHHPRPLDPSSSSPSGAERQIGQLIPHLPMKICLVGRLWPIFHDQLYRKTLKTTRSAEWFSSPEFSLTIHWTCKSIYIYILFWIIFLSSLYCLFVHEHSLYIGQYMEQES